MCGIAGLFHFSPENPIDPVLLGKMADCLSHRGPDGHGAFIDKNVGLAHRRLSVIDLASGDQPMFNEDKTLAVVFNGEIYNYKELRAELMDRGHRFTTDSDTEVILHGYEEWGTACVHKFIGMWAFALWDARRKKLWLSRDRIGEKPLYYGIDNQSIVFGSEIKSLVAYGFPGVTTDEFLALYLFLGFIPAPYTFYKNIFKLRPGHHIVVSRDTWKEVKYWSPPDITERDLITDRGYVNREFERLFYDALNMQLRSDVPIGVFLSGGLDSGSILAGVSGLGRRSVTSVTVGFPEAQYDERKLAGVAARAFDADHYAYVLQKEALSEQIHKILWHFDEPFADPAAMPLGYMAKLARKKIKVALAGDGGDEALSGYNTYQSEKFSAGYQHVPEVLKKSILLGLGLLDTGWHGLRRYQLNRFIRVMETAAFPFTQRLIEKLDPVSARTLASLCPGHCMPVEDYLSDMFARCPFTDSFYRLMWYHYTVFLPERMLPKVDRMSMAHGLEVRTPFLDYRILALMYRTHKRIKMRGFSRKSVLKDTVARKLPAPVLNAAKKGFEVPLREWFIDDSYAEILQELRTRDLGLNRSLIRRIIDDHRQRKQDYGLFIWKLILYCCWLDK